MKKNKIKLLFLFCFVLLCSIVQIARAADVNVDFAATDLKVQNTSVPSFIGNLYIFILGIGGIVAVGVIIFGGILFIAEGAAPDKKNQAKELILGSLWGLGLLLFSYLILKTVNPELVTLRDPGGNITQNVDIEDCQKNIDLPYCVKPEDPMINKDGKCICRKKIDAQFICSLNMKNPKTNESLTYAWTKEGRVFPEGSRTLDAASIPPITNEADGCPYEVSLSPGTTPFFITKIDTDKFIMDIGAIKKKGKLTNDERYPIPLPLPEGEYKAYFSPYHLKDKPGKAMCLLTGMWAILASNPGVTIYKNDLLTSLDGSSNLVQCKDFSKDVSNETELKIIENTNQGLGGNCTEVVLGPCSAANLSSILQSKCPEFSGYASQLSQICNRESAGNPTRQSETDWCNGGEGCGGPADKNHAASIGLFQINTSANATFLPRECKNLYNGSVAGDAACEPKYKNGYKCSYKSTDPQYNLCRNTLSIPETNIEMVCNMMRGRRGRGEGIFSDWKNTVDVCNIENPK